MSPSHPAPTATTLETVLRLVVGGLPIWQHLAGDGCSDTNHNNASNRCQDASDHGAGQASSTSQADLRLVCRAFRTMSYPLMTHVSNLHLGQPADDGDDPEDADADVSDSENDSEGEDEDQTRSEDLDNPVNSCGAHRSAPRFTEDPATWPQAQQEQQQGIIRFLSRLTELQSCCIMSHGGGTSQLMDVLLRQCLAPGLTHLRLCLGGQVIGGGGWGGAELRWRDAAAHEQHDLHYH